MTPDEMKIARVDAHDGTISQEKFDDKILICIQERCFITKEEIELRSKRLESKKLEDTE